MTATLEHVVKLQINDQARERKRPAVVSDRIARGPAEDRHAAHRSSTPCAAREGAELPFERTPTTSCSPDRARRRPGFPRQSRTRCGPGPRRRSSRSTHPMASVQIDSDRMGAAGPAKLAACGRSGSAPVVRDGCSPNPRSCSLAASCCRLAARRAGAAPRASRARPAREYDAIVR